MRYCSYVILFLLAGQFVQAQNKPAAAMVVINGKVTDARDQASLTGAAISINNSGGTVTDNKGRYTLNSPAGRVRVRCEFLGYISRDTILTLTANTSLNFALKSVQTALNQVNITSAPVTRKEIATQNLTVLQGAALERTRGLSLGESLKSITGVTTYQTGASISKPIIHGVYSNRILILNNGIRLEAQQWGSEHAPEIDPFIANKLEVIKGAAGIRYGSDAIGGVILAEPKALPSVPGMDGEVNAVGMSNGRLGAASAMLEGALGGKLTGLSYRVQGTLKEAGNVSTPNYLLENTGLREKDFSAAAQYHHDRYGIDAYYSNFNTKLGIFTGADAHTPEDLQLRISEPQPLTPSYFSYQIDQPYQTVNHALAKLKGFYNFENGDKLQVTVAQQINTRSEYDFPSNSGYLTPDLYFRIITQTVDISYDQKQGSYFSGAYGFNGITQGNVRKYGYFIPNFRDYGGGAYYTEKYERDKWLFEAGLRYDYRWLKAYKFNDNLDVIETPVTHYQSLSSILGATYNLTPDLKLSGNFSSAFRAPTVNELYANGIHDLFTFEKGNPDLKTERANNFSVDLNYGSKVFQASVQAYYNNINNFIFLNPTNKFVRNQAGSALEFDYTQANVYFRGLDIDLLVRPLDSLEVSSKTSLIYAFNKTINDYLINTPPERFQNGLAYHLGSIGVIKNLLIGVEDVYVARQNHFPAKQNYSDYAPPPGAYNLVNAHLGFRLNFDHTHADVDFAVNNITNTAYRDYLDRFRYFTDEPGRNFILRLRVPFKISNHQ